MQCTAKSKRTGERCRAHAMKGTTVCRMHGGPAVRRGNENGNYKHGRYSKYLPATVRAKVEAFEDTDPLDLLDELNTQRALLADYLERYQFQAIALPAHEIDRVMAWVNDVGRMVERMVKIRNESALTAAEIAYLKLRMKEAIAKYIDDPDKREAFIREVFGLHGDSQPRTRTPERISASD